MEQSNKKCRNCSQIKEINEFPLFSTSSAGRKNTCRSCTNELAVIRRDLKLKNPPPPSGNCPICNNYTQEWILDHCHFSHQFRGYICNSCNLGLGRFNDDITILQNAIDYLTEDHIIDYQI
jgi:hypothetical protein